VRRVSEIGLREKGSRNRVKGEGFQKKVKAEGYRN
jgi:hypothetical protein